MIRRLEDRKLIGRYRLKILMLLLVIVVMMATGCTTINRALQVAASINDTALASAEDMQCNRASIRAIRDRYKTEEQRRAYNMLCGKILAED